MRKLRPHSFGEKPRRPRSSHVAVFSLLAIVFVVLSIVMVRAVRADAAQYPTRELMRDA